jgi:nicotinamide N-methyltransferase
VRGKRVYEIGCGAALPSLLSAKLGAQFVVAAEYPDKELIDNVNYNFDQNLSAEERAHTQVLGHVWGRTGPEGKFDLMF